MLRTKKQRCQSKVEKDGLKYFPRTINSNCSQSTSYKLLKEEHTERIYELKCLWSNSEQVLAAIAYGSLSITLGPEVSLFNVITIIAYVHIIP